MDGRVQQPVINYLRALSHVDYVDMITEPGPDKILSDGTDVGLIASIRKRVEISIHKHHSRIIAIAGHHDCAGNPVPEGTHIAQLHASIQVIASWRLPVQEIVALWLDEHFDPEKVYHKNACAL